MSLDEVDPLISLKGDYSQHCSLSPRKIAPWGSLDAATKVINVRDTRKIKPDSCHVIICDPPYGFNIEHDATKLALLYAQVIRAMILALKDNGQLVLCVPEYSYTGRPLVFFTDKDVIIQQVLTTAEECGRQAIMPAKSLLQLSSLRTYVKSQAFSEAENVPITVA